MVGGAAINFDIIAHDRASSTFSKVGAMAAVGLGAVVAGGIKAIGAASDLNETLSKSKVIFGAQAPAMERWAAGAAKSAGLSKQAALDAAAGFGDMFSQLGFAGSEAANMSRTVVQLGADLGSFNNLPTAEVNEMIAASFRGEYDSLQRVIPNINAARVETEALAATGKKSAKELTAQEKAAATLAIIQKDGSRAAGDFARTSGGLANQQKILRAQIENVQASIGTKLLPMAASFANFANDKLVPVITSVADNLDTIGPAIGVVVTGMGVFKAASLAQAAALAIQTAGTTGATGATWSLNAALRANPIGLVVTALTLLGVGLVMAYKKSETFRAIVNAGFTAVKVVAASVASFFTVQVPAAFNKVRNAASSVIGWVRGNWPLILGILTGPFGIAAVLIAKNWGKIKDGATSVKDWIRDKFDDIVGFAKSLPGRITRAASGAFSGLVSAFRNAINSIIGKWNNLSFSLPGIDTKIPGVGKVGGVTINTPNIPYMAKGGIVTRPTLAMIGEAGPEAVIPLSGPHARKSGSHSTEAPIIVNVYVEGSVKSEHDLVSSVMQGINEARRRNGNRVSVAVG